MAVVNTNTMSLTELKAFQYDQICKYEEEQRRLQEFLGNIQLLDQEIKKREAAQNTPNIEKEPVYKPNYKPSKRSKKIIKKK